MRNYITLILLFSSFIMHAQNKKEVKNAFDSYQYEKVITLSQNSKDPEIMNQRIAALKALGHYSLLMNELTTLFASDTANISCCTNIAECYRSLGNNYKAAIFYDKASKIQPDNKFFKLQKIRSLIAADENDSVISACHKFIDFDSLSCEGYKYMGIAYENKHDLSNAFFSFNIAYRRDSTDSQVVYHIAKLFNDNKQFKDAQNITEKYREKDTTNIDVNRQNAIAYCLNGDYKKAIERYESLKKLGDNSVSTLYYLGIAYYGDNWFYGAYDNFNLAIQKNPNDVNVLYYLAKSCARTSWKKEGVDYMKKALELTVPSDSTLVWLYKGLSDCCARASGNNELRIETLKQLYALTHDYVYFYTIARCYDYDKKTSLALANYERFVSLVPADKRIINEEGDVKGQTLYQLALKKIKDIKADNFFKGKK